MHRAQPAEEQAGNQRAAGGRQGERNAADLVDERADQRADGDRRADEGDVRDVGRAVGVAQRLRGGADVLRASDEGEDVAAVDLRIRKDRNVGRGRAPGDLAQEDAASASAIFANSASVFPSASLLVTRTSTPSIGTASNSRSSTSSARAPISLTSTSRGPAIATTSPAWITVSAVASMICPPGECAR